MKRDECYSVYAIVVNMCIDECQRMAFHCEADKKCGRQCDGIADCSGGEDEAGCG